MALDSLSKPAAGAGRRQTVNQLDALRRVADIAEVAELAQASEAQAAFDQVVAEERAEEEAAAEAGEGQVAGLSSTNSGNPAVDRIEQQVKQRLQANLQARAKAIVAKATAQRATQVAGQVAVRSAATAAAGASSFALGPILIGVGVVIIVAILIGLVFVSFGAVGKAQGEGSLTGTDNQIITVAEARTNGARGLKLINSPTDYVEATTTLLQQAEELFKSTAEGALKQQLLPILEKMRQQAQEIEALNNKGDRAIVAKKYQELLATSREFNKLLVGDECGSATVCLDVPLVGQGKGGQCGIASMIMVLLYYQSVYPEYTLQAPAIYDAATQQVKTSAAWSCVSPVYMNARGPLVVKDWTWTCHTSSDKYGCTKPISRQSITQAIRRSLDNGDPVVLYLEPGGAVGGQHIVAVVGYDLNDEPEQGGVFIINNPNVHLEKSVKQTRYRNYQKKDKLTIKHIEEYYGGANNRSYSVTAMIRQQYLSPGR